MSAPDILTVQELAERLKLHPQTIREAAMRGDLPGQRFGRVWRFSWVAVEEWLRRGTQPPSGRRR
jgi:excisionase family DNA binding protein